MSSASSTLTHSQRIGLIVFATAVVLTGAMFYMGANSIPLPRSGTGTGCNFLICNDYDSRNLKHDMAKFVLLFILTNLTTLSYANMMGQNMGNSDIAPPIPPGHNVAPNIRNGYGLVQTYCVQCHQSPNPNQHTAAEWPGVLNRMHRYMQQQHHPIPTETDRKLILDYLDKTD